jgi:hypothetical protein
MGGGGHPRKRKINPHLMTTFTGGCLCRAIRYEASGPLVPLPGLSVRLRRRSEHAVLMPSDAVKVVKGTPRLASLMQAIESQGFSAKTVERPCSPTAQRDAT